MSKLSSNAPSNSGKCKDTITTTTNYNTGRANYIIYLLCITSLGFSVYTILCHSQLEDRIRQIHHLDDRVSVLEDKLRIFPIQFLQSLATKLPSSSFSSSNIDNSSVPDSLVTDDVTVDDFADIVRKLSVQISGIQRLRRDVSHLKASRRGERQASSPPTTDACMCPPGKIIYIFYASKWIKFTFADETEYNLKHLI